MANPEGNRRPEGGSGQLVSETSFAPNATNYAYLNVICRLNDI